ncbi:MAG: type II toxin-antitoxin system Phd/YefM family antitoxin [Deltaproteobacteria bacterium]|nr:type II toxin-antitoxin system Phd/YefM family antitoxin [Deltaproteobacteria bacterium]
MTLSISQDIKSVSDLKKKTNEIFKQMHDTGRPIIVTVNGRPDAVLLDVEVFENKLKSLNLGLLLTEAEGDVREHRTRKARAFLKELKSSAKVSG